MKKNDKIINCIQILRKSGFFSEYTFLNDDQLFDKLHKDRVLAFSEIFKKPYDPGMDMECLELAAIDVSKVILIDLNADVTDKNKIYASVIENIFQLGGSDLSPQNINEKWASDSGPIEITFDFNENKYKFIPEFRVGWLDEAVFIFCKKHLENYGHGRIVMSLQRDDEGGSATIAVFKLTKEEQSVLESECGWKFSK